MEIHNIADLVNPESGKTYRQENAAKVHNIPIGSLVEILHTHFPPKTLDYYNEESYDGLRMFVIERGRDCDQTPLYWLSIYPPLVYLKKMGDLDKVTVVFNDDPSSARFKGRILGGDIHRVGGLPENDLKVIRLGREEDNDE